MGGYAWTRVPGLSAAVVLWLGEDPRHHVCTQLEPRWASPLLPVSQAHTVCVDTLKSVAKYLCLLVFVPCLALHVKFLFERDVGEPYGKA